MVTLLGIIALGIVSLFGGAASLGLPGDLSEFLLLVLGVSVLSGVLGTTMYYRGIKHVHATSASIFELAFPITGFIIDIFVHSKTPDNYQILGGIVLVIVMIFIARTKKE